MMDFAAFHLIRLGAIDTLDASGWRKVVAIELAAT